MLIIVFDTIISFFFNKTMKQINFIILKKISSRYLIHKILDGVFISKKTSSQTLDFYLNKGNFKPHEVAQAERISNFIFVHLESIDKILYKILKKKTNLSIINIFRIVISELVLNEAPDYALVNSAVDLGKVNVKTKHFLSLINAISRRLVEKYRKENFILKSNLETNLKNYLKNNYSPDIAKKIEQIFFLKHAIDITVKNPNEIAIWKKKLDAILLPTGSLRLKINKKISSMCGFKEGKWWVQDISSSIPVKLLGDVKGKEVLDLFSAPGGKSMQLIALGANVTCVDQSLKRIKMLEENLLRMKMKTEIIKKDFYKFESKKKFDIVLIDVPCSATGTIKKNKELQYLFPQKRLINLLKLQKDALIIAKNYVNDNGLILYCNCSLFFSEGEKQILDFIDYNKDWYIEKISEKNKYVKSEWLDNFGFLRLRPDHLFDLGGMDGFFAAILKKKITINSIL